MPGVDGMEVLRTAREEPSARAGHHDHRVRLGRPGGRGDQGRRVRLHREAVRAGLDPRDRRQGDRPGRREQARAAPDAVPRRRPSRRGKFGLVGTSTEMHAIFAIIEKVADTPSTVLITGESGTGKELVAQRAARALAPQGQAVHQDQLRRDPQDADRESSCSATRRARSPARRSSKPGRFELADGGTLFLDEIGEIPVEMQVKLLRALQESEFERVGGIKTIKVDVRLIAATNRDLEQEIAARQLPRGPVLPAQRRAAAAPAAARAHRRHPAARRSTSSRSSTSG